MSASPILALHGGAGTIPAATLTPELTDAYHDGIRTALAAGHAVLKSGGTALDAVTRTVIALEENPLFNAGRGAVYTTAETHEMDAAVMDGATGRAGAVAGLCGPRNPVLAARAVMEKSPHVFLAGEGAMRFCHEAGLEFMDPAWFGTERRLDALRQEMARRASGAADTRSDADRHGTVGAVALDRHGNLAAATSTGGITGKTPGRVGDSPVIGAGTWADNATCAISATGQGELFIRVAAAHEIAARMRWGGQSLEAAADDVVNRVLAPIGGSGGLIALDAHGHVALPFNCEGMYRGVVGADDLARSAIHREDWRSGRL
ncbi:isoaspartyl dipeptidase with L-asparaginase activity [uncultured Alphaproteobacteria bacterium]|uniref:Isoaspartyl peptidase n=1 Tax=uncultured Alphaproteobacteria bacterium TaxID=91750 RepID=A0A212K2S0_9PROT|nr:isoaspartyl dipeptidase with L-asparaginase activity [uncultured Alphaproteobacteria bacterium]